MLTSAVDLIQATVQLEQPVPGSGRTVGTGFLIASRGPDGAPRTVLVTAHHVLAGMAAKEATVGYRATAPDGAWSYSPQKLRIRDDEGAPTWTSHPTRDVAAIVVNAPPEFARAAIPEHYLLSDDALVAQTMAPGQELMVLGYPRGLAANTAGFPILRAGRIASYPLNPNAWPTFLLDFAVFPGNSGGPVFMPARAPMQAGAPAPAPYIAGVLTQQVELNKERLEIGIVVHARYVSETLAIINGGPAPSPVITAERSIPGASPAAAAPPRPAVWSLAGLRSRTEEVRRRAERSFRSLRVQLAAWIALKPMETMPAAIERSVAQGPQE